MYACGVFNTVGISVNRKHLPNIIFVSKDAADILSRGTPSPAELTSAVLPSVTLSAVPPASIWAVPISVRIDELRPYTPYVFEVSAFTSDGEGQIASTMVRMPEAGMPTNMQAHVPTRSKY